MRSRLLQHLRVTTLMKDCTTLDGPKPYLALGDPQTCQQIKRAMTAQLLPIVADATPEIKDAWEEERWFPLRCAGVFICVGLLGQTSVDNFMFTLAGSLNVIRAAVGRSLRLILVSDFPSAEFFLLQRLVDLYYAEQAQDFYALTRNFQESPDAFANRCVLYMCNVSAKEARTESSSSSHQKREVRDSVVPQSPSIQNHPASDGQRPAESVPQSSAGMLEVQVQAPQKEPSRDLRSELATAVGQAAVHSVQHHAGTV